MFCKDAIVKQPLRLLATKIREDSSKKNSVIL
jgi:hypothetical protein